LKPDIPYEKGVPDMFCIIGTMVIVFVGIVPLLEVVGVWLVVVLVGEGGGGGTTPPLVAARMEV
jgi:hypothetical protein